MGGTEQSNKRAVVNVRPFFNQQAVMPHLFGGLAFVISAKVMVTRLSLSLSLYRHSLPNLNSIKLCWLFGGLLLR